MKVKIVPKCGEKKLNRILEGLEKSGRAIDDVKLYGKQIWILSYKIVEKNKRGDFRR